MSQASRSDEARSRRKVGLRAEAVAESFLVTRGFFPVARNHVVRGGEVDLVMRDGETVVFVEVRQRRRGAMVDALESVTLTKQRRVVRAAADYLVRANLGDRPVRFDVVALTSRRGGPPELVHVVAAFDAAVADGQG